MPFQAQDYAAENRAEFIVHFMETARSHLRSIVHVALDDLDTAALGVTLVQAFQTVLASAQGKPVTAIQTPDGQRQIGAIGVLLGDVGVAGSLFNALQAGKDISHVEEIIRSMYMQVTDTHHHEHIDASLMEVAARVVDMAFQAVIPPPRYHNGVESNEPEHLLLRLDDSIQAGPHPAASPPPPLPKPVDLVQGGRPLVRRPGFSGRGSHRQSPSCSPHAASPLRSRRHTPGPSGQLTPATPLSQALSSIGADGNHALNRQLPPVPNGGTPVSSSPSTDPPLSLLTTTSLPLANMTSPNLPPISLQLAHLSPPSVASTNPPPPSTASANQLDLAGPPTAPAAVTEEPQGASTAPHPEPCQYASAPVIVRRRHKCRLCPTVTGLPGSPCVEEEVEAVVHIQLRPTPYPEDHSFLASSSKTSTWAEHSGCLEEKSLLPPTKKALLDGEPIPPPKADRATLTRVTILHRDCEASQPDETRDKEKHRKTGELIEDLGMCGNHEAHS
ncbi:hypothetical protein FA13DRAFT_1712412 [Coprinellus micaceus]|uniref:Uncharacterized protein n=1 Tax=Coprinellus micaceus TaxID=71717 RepID=A0A4Y7T0M0_COPMI|nr:hypothetical protein FA13DRAFT_1712412 [Coprinellus micaceus]